MNTQPSALQQFRPDICRKGIISVISSPILEESCWRSTGCKGGELLTHMPALIACNNSKPIYVSEFICENYHNYQNLFLCAVASRESVLITHCYLRLAVCQIPLCDRSPRNLHAWAYIYISQSNIYLLIQVQFAGDSQGQQVKKNPWVVMNWHTIKHNPLLILQSPQ